MLNKLAGPFRLSIYPKPDWGPIYDPRAIMRRDYVETRPYVCLGYGFHYRDGKMFCTMRGAYNFDYDVLYYVREMMTAIWSDPVC